jgi:ribonucleoside-diphosphate reductase beta chain
MDLIFEGEKANQGFFDNDSNSSLSDSPSIGTKKLLEELSLPESKKRKSEEKSRKLSNSDIIISESKKRKSEEEEENFNEKSRKLSSSSELSQSFEDSSSQPLTDNNSNSNGGKEIKKRIWRKGTYLGVSEYVPYPLKNKSLKNLYLKARSVFWTEDAIDLTHDAQDFKKLSPKEQNLLKLVLAFFARSDGLVNKNLVLNFYEKITIPEARLFYSYQIYIESIHAMTYARLISTYIKDTKEQKQLLINVDLYKSVGLKESWIKKWIDDSSNSLAESLIAFICVEGVFFSASFCVIYWFKQYKKGLLSGLIVSNGFIARDEATHADCGVELVNLLHEKPTQQRVHEIFKSGVECEKAFVHEALPSPLPGMNADLMIQYIKYISDYWIMQLGYQPLFNEKNPFQWMELLELKERNNFFEQRSTEYVTSTPSSKK